MSRLFVSDLVAIQRAVDAGGFQPTITYATLAGLDAVEAQVQHMSSAQAARALGILATDAYLMDLDNDLVPDGQRIRVSDRVVIGSGDNAGTYTIMQALLVDGREWNCTMQRLQLP